MASVRTVLMQRRSRSRSGIALFRVSGEGWLASEK
jgi:hypothetical protein